MDRAELLVARKDLDHTAFYLGGNGEIAHQAQKVERAQHARSNGL